MTTNAVAAMIEIKLKEIQQEMPRLKRQARWLRAIMICLGYALALFTWLKIPLFRPLLEVFLGMMVVAGLVLVIRRKKERPRSMRLLDAIFDGLLHSVVRGSLSVGWFMATATGQILWKGPYETGLSRVSTDFLTR